MIIEPETVVGVRRVLISRSKATELAITINV